MKVFISWSGTSSREVAEALSDWFPKVIQGVEPFVSAKDIDKGANWTVELARELTDSDFGVICIAPDNLLSPWLNYEAGAIAKSVDSRVCPVLLGVDKGAVRPPISQLQMTAIDPGDFALLMASMNKAAGSPLTPAALQEAVDIWWPKLQQRIDAIPVPKTPETSEGIQEPAQPESTTHEMLTELLQRVRGLDSRLGRVERSSRLRNGPVHGSVIGTKSRQDDPVESLVSAASRHGLHPETINISGDGVEVSFNVELPEPLPIQAYADFGEIAKRMAAEIRLVGADRVIVFNSLGDPNEPPF